MEVIKSMEFRGLKIKGNSHVVSWKRNQKQKPADLGESDSVSGKVTSVVKDESEGPGAWKNKKLKKSVVLLEAAVKIDPSHLADFFAKPISACNLKLCLFCLINSTVN
ncbi:unnamed protein product [Arabidopsis thaliana]|uniref:Uncharacterized protein n=1 Tax=Arabidopsis thaliana TaxID=3702 RepID=A0A5S9XIA3_ARATH|nr:unnamed protein product [Arabidopsis thaliana]